MTAPVQGNISQKEIARDAAAIRFPEAPLSVTHKWYFSRKEIECHTPSRADGIDYKRESHLRKLYCSFLQELGIELKVPQVTIATALMFCHRFYMRQSHAKNDWQTIATVCMFLACKAEETPRWLGELVVVAYKLIYKWDPSASRRIREIYDKQKELIVTGETLLLATLAFDLNIEHPYKPLVAAVKRLDIQHKDLVKVAWNFVNDWLRCSLCLQHKPHYIAAGSLFLAAKIKKVKLPAAKGKSWWMEFDVSPKQLEDVIQQMMRLWEQNQKLVLPPKDQKVTEPTVRKATTSSPQSCILSDSSIALDSKMITPKDIDGPAKSVTSDKVEKQVFHTVHESSKGKANCETSDSGSANSVVENTYITAIKDVDGPAKSVTSNCLKRQALNNFHNTCNETENRQTSDSSSANSVVEDGDGNEPVTGKSEPSTSYKIGPAGSEYGNVQVDVNQIKEKLKKRKLDRSSRRRCAEDMDDEIDGEDWIERELEKGIVLEPSDAEKRRRL